MLDAAATLYCTATIFSTESCCSAINQGLHRNRFEGTTSLLFFLATTAYPVIRSKYERMGCDQGVVKSMKETPSSNPSDSDGDNPGDVSGLTGRVIDDRYRLEAHLGGGGMGEVYRAEHTLMHKIVAVKLLRPEVARDESIIERFRREAAAAGNLDHPNICAATDFGKTGDGYFYLVMEYIDGESLKDLLAREGPLPIEQAVTIADGVAAALEKADELDVVHRDIKPDNIMLVDSSGRGPEVKVLDFGVAHVEFNDDMPSLTKTGAVFGTPSYMAPEQATGEEVDHRSDLYGLGVLLYEMITGRELFVAEESAQLMAKHIMEDPDPPSSVTERRDLPAPLEKLVLELLEKKPEDRPQSAADVRRRLQPYTEEASPTGSVSVPTPSANAQSKGQSATRVMATLRDRTTDLIASLRDGNFKRQPVNLALAGIAGVLVVLVGLLFVTSLYLLIGESPEETRESLAERRAEFKQKPEIQKALAPLEAGRPADAVHALEAVREKRADKTSPHLHYLTGAAYAKIGNETRALEAFRRAAEADSTYLYDQKLLELLAESIGSGNSDRSETALAFAGAFIDHEPVRNRVAKLAWKPDSDRTRERAWNLLESEGALGSVPEWQRLSIKLRRADACDGYEKYVDAIIDLGEPRGVEILKIYDDKPRRGCSVRGLPLVKTRDCYACIRDDLERGIEKLEGLE